MSSRAIEIIGGGLAGLSLGLALRRAETPVTVFDAGSYPRHRVCGEFIAGLDPATMTRLELGPLLADALLHRTVGWFIGTKLLQSQCLPAPALGISRFALDARLAEAFVAAGGDLRTGTRINDAENCPGRVFSTGRVVTRSRWLGLKVHARGLLLQRDLEVHLGENAYVGLSRVEDGAVNVCGLFRRRERGDAVGCSEKRNSEPRPAFHVLLDYLKISQLESVAGRLEGSDIDRESFSSVAALDFARPRTTVSQLCIGDRWAMPPPFTGNGMAMAFQGAALVVDPILRYARGEAPWDEVCRTATAALESRFRMRLASAGILHPFLLKPPRQRWLAALTRARLLPFRPLYAALH